MDLLDALENDLITGDGAMGTLLMERGAGADQCLEAICLENPDMIRKIHDDYIAAGTRVVETNSFGANAVRLARHGLENRVNEINWKAAQIAREAAKGRDVIVAGSVGPLGIGADEASEKGIDRLAVFSEQIGALLDGGAQAIVLETFLDEQELAIALEAKLSLHHCPVICMMACHETGRLSSGQPLADALANIAAAGADVIGVNCLNGPRATVKLLETLPLVCPLAAYPNAGNPSYHDGRFLYHATPEYFATAARELAAQGARLVGGCCGTGPRHIEAIARALKEAIPPKSKSVRVISAAPAAQSSPATPDSGARETSLLDLIAEGRKVIVAELDPPKTLSMDKFLKGAKAIAAAGADCITLADNSLAILRVSNLAAAAILKERHGIVPLLHLSCRDRNLLGLQSELMGMAALGMRHVLPLTGDPAKVGDHPGATSVYDINSVKLIEVVRRMNEGFNHNGKSLKGTCDFVIGCTYNPNARNVDAQVQRLERKVAAGAQYVMTQPVFDMELVKETARRTAPLGIPVFVGVWPLLNGRQAEFLHNEVPGISIPDPVRTRMRGLEDSAGRDAGLAIAREVCSACVEHFPGVYLITPFLNYELTAQLAEFVRST